MAQELQTATNANRYLPEGSCDVNVKGMTMSNRADLNSSDDCCVKLFMSMVDGFALHDVIFDDSGSPADYRFLEVNPAFEIITGLASKNIIGRTVREVFPKHGALLTEHFADVTLSGEPRVFERHNLVTGRYLKVTAYYPGSGRLACVVVDVTELKLVELALVEQEQQVRERSRKLEESTRRFEELALQNEMVHWDVNADGLFTYVSNVSEAVYGYRPDEIIGRLHFYDLHPEEGRDAFKAEVFETFTRKDTLRNRENPVQTRDGLIIWVATNGIPLLADNGTLAGYRGSDTNITEHKLIEEALKESEATFRAHVENSFDVIFTLDATGAFVFVSPAWERHFGYPVSDVLGQSFAPFVHPDDVEPCSEYLIRILGSGQSGTSPVYRVKCADGSFRSFVANGMPYIDTKGQLLFIGVGHDVTDQLQAERDRLDFERQLLHTQKLESLGILAGGIAHDFNNLLLTILGNVELAALKISPDSAQYKLLGQATLAANRAADLTSCLLAYSGRGAFVITRLNMNRLINENATLLRTAIPRTVSIVLRLSDGIPDIMGDVAQIQQVVMNLITNASEAMEGKSGHIKLSTGLHNYDHAALSTSRLEDRPEPGDFVYLEVSDNGIGMSEQTQQRVFDPFFTTKFTGRGLGMSAVLGIIKAHSGALFLDSAPGRGTTIRVIFPATAEAVPSPAESVGAAIPAFSYTPLTGTVLVVDDEKSVLRVCVSMVKLCGFSVITASDGAEAVSTFRKRVDEIDLVLMDLTMPKMDGIAAMLELRRIKPDLKIILSSGFNEQELDERINGQNPSGFIPKPYRMNNLETELRRVMLGSAMKKG